MPGPVSSIGPEFPTPLRAVANAPFQREERREREIENSRARWLKGRRTLRKEMKRTVADRIRSRRYTEECSTRRPNVEGVLGCAGGTRPFAKCPKSFTIPGCSLLDGLSSNAGSDYNTKIYTAALGLNINLTPLPLHYSCVCVWDGAGTPLLHVCVCVCATYPGG